MLNWYFTQAENMATITLSRAFKWMADPKECQGTVSDASA